MGIDMGFDMIPRLDKTQDDDIDRWQRFILDVQQQYAGDPSVDMCQPDRIEFCAGEHPKLPYEGHKFLRFSSKISGRNGSIAEKYIKEAFRLAKARFGDRLRLWHECFEGTLDGIYGWEEVHESIPSFKEQDECSTLSAGSPKIQQTRPSFRMQSLPCKGWGIVACTEIARGTLIFSEEPLFKIPRLSQDPESVQHSLICSLRALTKDQQRTFFQLSNNFKSMNVFLGIVKTNAMPLGADASEGAIFPVCSRFNHSCVSNAAYSWNSKAGEEQVYAINTIKKNEEITVSYLTETEWLLPTDLRREQIKKKLGFHCQCHVCSGPVALITQSDEGRIELARLQSAVGAGVLIVTDPSRALQNCRRALHLLYSESYLDMTVHSTYYDAFQVCVAHGDLARASTFADLALQAKADCQGSDADGMDDRKVLVSHPERHRLFGTTNKWRSKVQHRRSQSASGFEDWLWQRSS